VLRVCTGFTMGRGSPFSRPSVPWCRRAGDLADALLGPAPS